MKFSAALRKGSSLGCQDWGIILKDETISERKK
jgi:hypothetical protein